MRVFNTAIFACCAAAVALSQPTIASRLADRIRAEHLKADVAFLASDALQGRATPSPGLDAAAEYIASQFRKAGLEPIGDDGFFQTATYNVVTPNFEALEISSGSAHATTAMVVDPVATDLKNASVVKTTPAEFEKLTVEQVRGKVLAIDGSIRPSAALLRLEPAAVLILLAESRAMTQRAVLREVSAPAPKATVFLVADAALREALVAPGATVSIHLAAPKMEPSKVRNVAGLLRGSDPALKDTHVLVTGHYDHLGVRPTGDGDRIFNGANDDASGTASVIEIAAALASLGERPRRSLLFLAFFGEEAGLVGSRYYTSHPLLPLRDAIADINLEHMGRTDDNQGPRVGQFNLTGFDYTDIAATMTKAGAETGVAVVKHDKYSDVFFPGSDNASFASAGVPATTISVTYLFPDYHAVGDEWPKLDYPNLAKVNQCAALGIWNLANSEKVPEWNRGSEKTKAFVEAFEKLKAGR